MTPFDYKYQNPFACLMLIRPIVIFTPQGIQNLNKKRKTNWILVVVVKWSYRESCIFTLWARQNTAMLKKYPGVLHA